MRKQAADALAELIDALVLAGIVLPSAGIDGQSAFTGRVLVDLGRARPDVVVQLARVIRAGAEALRASDG
ncbi:hypothetical protein [Kitasatospora sp. MAP12-22]